MLANYLKRFCAMLVAVVMLLSCMPLSALAETVENAETQTAETPQTDTPAPQPAAEAPAPQPVAEDPAPQPVASVEIPAAVENIIDKAEQVQDEVEQLEETTTEQLEDKLESVEKAEEAVEELEDLTDAAEEKIDDLEEAIPNVQDAVNKETVTETQGKDALKAQHAETEAALNAAQKQQEEAAAALELAKQEYEAAKAQSEEAEAAAMEKLLAAQEELAKAEQGTAIAKQAVDAVAKALNGIQDAVEQAQENTGALLEDLKTGLEESKEELKASIEDLNQATGEVKENAETLITELENLQASAEKFEESVVTAKTTEEKVLDMRAEYEEAMKALEAAQAAYDALIAEGGDVSAEKVQTLKDAMVAAGDYVAQMEVAMAAYSDKAYEENLEILGSKDPSDMEKKPDAEKAVAKALVGKLAEEGQKVEWVGANSTYGKSDNGFYVVLDGDKVVGRYGYEIKGDKLSIYEMTSSDSVHTVTLGGVTTEIDTTKTEIEIKDTDGNTVETIYKDGETGSSYYYKEACEVDTITNVSAVNGEHISVTKEDEDGIKEFTYTRTFESVISWIPYKTGEVTYTVNYVIDSDGNAKLKDTVRDGLTLTALLTAAYANEEEIDTNNLYDLTTDDPYEVVGKNKVTVSGDKKFVEIDGKTIEIITEGGKTYLKQNAGVQETSDPQYLTYSITGNAANGDSADEYAKKKKEAEDAYKDAVNAQNAKQSEYDKAEEQYNKLQAELDKMAKAKEKDLEVTVLVKIGNLADLPVTIDEILRPEDFQDPEKREELVDAMQNIGSGGIGSAAGIIELAGLIGLDTADIFALTTAATVGTDFQKEYAKAWTDALTAKINVIISGFELVAQAGKTVEAGKELLASGVEASDKILEVAQNAAKVAGYTGAVGVVQLGDNALELTNQILSKLESKVTVLQLETTAAAKEVSAAKAALDEMIRNGYSPYSEIMQAAKARLDLAQSKYDALVKDLDKAHADLDVAYTKIGAISAPQKSAERTKSVRTFVLDEQRFQIRDAKNNVLRFPYKVEGNTLKITVTREKTVIIIEVAYMAELVLQRIEILEFRTANSTYVLKMSDFLKAHPEVLGTLEIDLEAGTYSYMLNAKRVTEKLELKK